MSEPVDNPPESREPNDAPPSWVGPASGPTPPKEPRRPFIITVRGYIRSYFAEEPLTFVTALVPLCFLAIALYTRHPRTNFIFDEQEALLANPFVRSVTDAGSKLHWIDAFRRDFWGLPYDRTIGSYRPLPDLVWRFFWMLGAREQSPFLHHWVNVLLHGVNGALMTLIALRLTKDRMMAWLTGATFTAAAVVTEAVSGVVGLADVLGALGALLALMSLALPLWAMPFAVAISTLVGLYSKESALCIVPLVPFACLLSAHVLHPKRPLPWVRTLVCTVAAGAAFVFYVEQRRHSFPASLPHELSIEANLDKPWGQRFYKSLLRWYAQPILPKDPLNNPLVDATGPQRIAGALRVYARGLGEVLLPYRLSGDYSAPQEPIPSRLVFPESVIGLFALAGPVLLSLWLALKTVLRPRPKLSAMDRSVAMTGVAGAIFAAGLATLCWLRVAFSRTPLTAALVTLGVMAIALVPIGLGTRGVLLGREDRDQPAATHKEGHFPHNVAIIVAIACMWVVVSYFPVSNIPIVLPTVRAERFWYFPVIGTSLLVALVMVRLLRFAALRERAWVGVVIVVGFFVWQSVAARAHANDYTDDLIFWNATRHAVPRSAKAHLNYSVMKGARGDLEERRRANLVALELAPNWPMASIYLGDTICRLHRPAEAWPYYKRGFDLASGDPNLVALALQCLWDESYYQTVQEELAQMGAEHRNSWLDFLQSDMSAHAEENKGVDPKYRPRGYNEGPKGD